MGAQMPALTVHDIGIRRRTVYNKCEGFFKCGDPVLDWAWQAGVHTLHAATDEAYSDCPWRERGSYIADCLVNIHINRVYTADLRTARRTFRNFGLAHMPDGLLPGCAPAWLRGSSEDFTLCWVMGIRDIWAYTGDREFAAQNWSVLQGIFRSPSWKLGTDGLWEAAGLFIDWGMLESERYGQGNTTLNIMRVAALRAAVEIADALGLTSDSRRYRDDAANTASSIVKHLWNEVEGRFIPSIGAATAAVHANVLALRYGLGDGARILTYLEPLLRDNFKVGRSNKHLRGYLELYFFFYVLPALAVHGRADLADSMIQEHYGFIKRLGYPTLPETFNRADHGSGSCCHSWSGAPAIYAIEYLLGLKLTAPGDPDSYTLAPADSGRDHAEGTLPHRLGPIHVSWRRQGNQIMARVIAPEAVTVVAGASVTLKRS